MGDSNQPPTHREGDVLRSLDVLTFWGAMRYVSTWCSARYWSLCWPFPGSVSNLPSSCRNVALVMCTRLRKTMDRELASYSSGNSPRLDLFFFLVLFRCFHHVWSLSNNPSCRLDSVNLPPARLADWWMLTRMGIWHLECCNRVLKPYIVIIPAGR